jgi:hypothetical protein
MLVDNRMYTSEHLKCEYALGNDHTNIQTLLYMKNVRVVVLTQFRKISRFTHVLQVQINVYKPWIADAMYWPLRTLKPLVGRIDTP